jgi:thiamine-monophosphate kinase
VSPLEIPERRLIRTLRRFGGKGKGVIRGIGDDCAVIRIDGKLCVLCQDAIVEGVHFSFSYMEPSYIGKKALYINISDVLSMGARPLYYLVTLGIPERIDSCTVKEIYGGMRNVAKEFNLKLLGGDTVSTEKDFFIDVSMVGELIGEKYKGREMAKDGDYIGVTGYLGESAFGLKVLREGNIKERGVRRFVERYVNPRPPYETWKELMKHDITNAMIDISDGLLIDLERMMEESKKCAIVHYEKLPIPELLKENSLEELALSGGEDYQFLFTFPDSKLKKVEELKRRGFEISVIGEVVKGRGVKLIKEGKVIDYKKKGYDHFLVE